MPGMFFNDDEHRDGDPERKKPALAQDLGPLPLWGWAIVVVGGVFVWRMMSGQAKVAAPAQGVPAYAPSGGGPGGVFLIPQGLTGGTGATPTPQDSGTNGVPWTFVLGNDANIYGRQLTNDTWGPWTWFGGANPKGDTTIGGPAGGFTSQPSLSGNWLFARGADNALWGRQFVNNAWTSWQSFGGALQSGPGGGTIYPGRGPSVAQPTAPNPADNPLVTAPAA